MEQIEDQKVVKLTYTLKEENANGTVLEEVDQQAPFKFLYGAGRLLPAFESNLEGLKPGEEFSFQLPPEEAYGEHSEEQVLDIPIELFDNADAPKEELLSIGNYLSLRDKNGQEHVGKVESVGGEAVTMDFNHAMAGKSLHFEGEILDIRDASSDEIAQKQAL